MSGKYIYYKAKVTGELKFYTDGRKIFRPQTELTIIDWKQIKRSEYVKKNKKRLNDQTKGKKKKD